MENRSPCATYEDWRMKIIAISGKAWLIGRGFGLVKGPTATTHV